MRRGARDGGSARANRALRLPGYARGNVPGRWWTHYFNSSEEVRAYAQARVGDTNGAFASGQLRYITEVDGELVSGLYPFISEPVDPWEVLSLEFLEPDHPVSALRPADPLNVTWGFYSPRAGFCYPGGVEPVQR